jgi:hypothetical protein
LTREGDFRVYNFEVEGFHTYFVSDLGLLVHNACVDTRINIANGQTKYTPLRPTTGKPVSAGFDRVLDQHFDRLLSNSRSIFTIPPEQLKIILQSDIVVKSPVKALSGGQFERISDTGVIVGNLALKFGGNPTTKIKVITDVKGNLISTFPVP